MPAWLPSRRAKKTQANRQRRRVGTAGVVLLAVLGETGALWRRSGRLGGRVIVRCQSGHLFTTIWIPAVSVKSLRFGPRRFQHCPVGHHWALVTPVKETELSQEQRRAAGEHRDVRLP